LSWLSVTTAYRNDDLSPHAFWLQAAHDNGIQDDAQVLRLTARARFYRDRIMWPKGKPYSAGIK
jgi:hypothetical protein